jgi:hypothetical protein
LVFDPVDEDCHHVGCVAVAAALVLSELGAECPHRAAAATRRVTTAVTVPPAEDHRGSEVEPCFEVSTDL